MTLGVCLSFAVGLLLGLAWGVTVGVRAARMDEREWVMRGFLVPLEGNRLPEQWLN